jgi:hypothetical protein
VITGIGVAVMHYLGMAAMRMPGRITYDPPSAEEIRYDAALPDHIRRRTQPQR